MPLERCWIGPARKKVAYWCEMENLGGPLDTKCWCEDSNYMVKSKTQIFDKIMKDTRRKNKWRKNLEENNEEVEYEE